MTQYRWKYLVIAPLLSVLSGCAAIVPGNQWPQMKVVAGQRLIADTPKNRAISFSILQSHVETEKACIFPPGFHNLSWQQYWHDSIGLIKKNQENADIYIDFIITERSKLGLPELL